jgi:hypothetical protein
MALAIGYSVGNWTALTNFVGDGRIDAHNNTAKRAPRRGGLCSRCGPLPAHPFIQDGKMVMLFSRGA